MPKCFYGIHGENKKQEKQQGWQHEIDDEHQNNYFATQTPDWGRECWKLAFQSLAERPI
jgi:hypothetical protein